MNTIPITPEACRPTYTVIGGRPVTGRDGIPVSVLLLNRGPRLYRADVIADLVRIGFDSILSVEQDADSPELESIVSRNPQVRFICMRDKTNLAIDLNVGMRESVAPYVLVLWNDLKLATSTLSSRFFDKVAELDAACLVPTLSDQSGAVVPSAGNPAHAGASFRIVMLPPRKDGDRVLYPFDACGIYNREKFMSLGGFDWTMDNPYWQKLDFGLRAWLWGESVLYAQALKLNYMAETPVEDTTPDMGYGRFWLKNLAPVFRGDSAVLPRIKFWKYLARSRMGPGPALEEFRVAREWVATCSYRFRQDATRLADLWDPMA